MIFWPMVKMILVLGGMCAVLLFLVRRTKRNGGLGRKDSLPDSGIRVLSTQPIAPQRYISLVEIGGEVLALGVAESQITLLTKVENKEFIGKVTDHAAGRPEALSFLRYLPGLPLRSKGSRPGLLRRGV